MKHVILVIMLVLGGIYMGYGFIPSTPKTVSEINANPQILNGLTFRKGDLEGLNVKNVHIKGMVFDDIQAEFSTFINVTFENCTFTKTNFRNSHFENVAFKNCTLQGNGDPEEVQNTTIFQYTVMKDILFESTKLKNAWIVDIDGGGGIIYFRNMHDVYPRGGSAPLFTGKDTSFRIVDSDLSTIELLVNDSRSASSFMARNSKFANHHFRSNSIYIENCILKTGGVVVKKDLVIKNSVVANTGVYVQNAGYLADNTYPDFEGGTANEMYNKFIFFRHATKIHGGKNSSVAILRSGTEPAFLGLESGNITMQGTTLDQMRLWPVIDEDVLYQLDMKNVTLRGGVWEGTIVPQGKWENVTIEPSILVDDTKISNIQAYNLQYPKGEPWRKEGEFTFDVTTVDKPFEWEEIHVPTPEELGLEWWPSEPGYHPVR